MNASDFGPNAPRRTFKLPSDSVIEDGLPDSVIENFCGPCRGAPRAWFLIRWYANAEKGGNASLTV